MEWLIENWDTIVQGITAIVTGASILAKLTPTQVDDEFIGKILQIIDKLALNTKPTEVKSNK